MMEYRHNREGSYSVGLRHMMLHLKALDINGTRRNIEDCYGSLTTVLQINFFKEGKDRWACLGNNNYFVITKTTGHVGIIGSGRRNACDHLAWIIDQDLVETIMVIREAWRKQDRKRVAQGEQKILL